MSKSTYIPPERIVVGEWYRVIYNDETHYAKAHLLRELTSFYRGVGGDAVVFLINGKPYSPNSKQLTSVSPIDKNNQQN